MTITQISTITQDQRSAKKKHSFPVMDIGTPKVPLRKQKKIKQQYELLSDWDHAS